MLRNLFTEKIKPLLASGGGSNHNNLKNRLLRGAAGSFGLQIASSGLGFVLSILFARLLGTTGLGTYSYATTWANLLSIPATLGIDNLIVREIAIYQTKSRWGLIGGLLRWSNLVVLAASMSLSLIAVAVAWSLKGSSDSSTLVAIAIALITVPIASMRNVRLGAMKGLHKIVLGQMPESLFSPMLLIVFTLGTYIVSKANFNVFWVLIIKIIVVTITFIIGAKWLWQSLPQGAKLAAPEYEVKKWFTSALPFMFLGTMQLINTNIDIVMLGAMKGVKAVGIYTIALGIVQLTIFIHQAANRVLEPTIASLYSEGRIEELQKIVQKSVTLVFLVSLSIAAVIIGLGHWVLLIFGSEFTIGKTAMSILIVGQLFNAFTGPVGLLLNMTGYQNYTAISVGASAFLNVIFNALLIPQFGINGAALATTFSVFIMNIVNIVLVRKKLNMYSTPWKIL